MSIKKAGNLTIISEETGEVKYKVETFSLPKEINYTKVYDEGKDVLCSHPVAYVVFAQITKRMTYAGSDDGDQIVHIDAYVRSKIAEVCKLKENTVVKAIKDLITLNAIRRVAKGVYQVNPTFAGKGEWKAIFVAREKYDDKR